MVNSGKVFVLDYPLLQGINNIEDVEVNDPNSRPMRKAVSPITVFASVRGNNAYTGKSENTLKPVAIQMDMNKGMVEVIVFVIYFQPEAGQMFYLCMKMCVRWSINITIKVISNSESLSILNFYQEYDYSRVVANWVGRHL